MFVAVLVVAILQAIFLIEVKGLDDGYALTPPMGFNSWNAFQRSYNEDDLYDIARLMEKKGLVDAGYKIFVVDGAWWNGDYENGIVLRNASGHFVDPLDKFPSGVKALSDYVRDKGMDFGWYTSGRKTACCCKNSGVWMAPMSQGYEEIDFAMFLEWNIKYLKVDNCGRDSSVSKKEIMKRWQNLVEGTGVVLENSRFNCKALINSNGDLVDPSRNEIPDWCEKTAHLWRVSKDIGVYIDDERVSSWDSIIFNIHAMRGLEHNAGPGGWNHPDMLDVGNGDLTLSENRGHFALWCVMSAPLMFGTDLRVIDTDNLDVLLNPEAIRIDQTWNGDAGHYLFDMQGVEAYAKRLELGQVALVLVNAASPHTLEYKFPLWFGRSSSDIFKDSLHHLEGDLKHDDALGCEVTDIWSGSSTFENHYLEGTLEPHGSIFVTLQNCVIARSAPSYDCARFGRKKRCRKFNWRRGRCTWCEETKTCDYNDEFACPPSRAVPYDCGQWNRKRKCKRNNWRRGRCTWCSSKKTCEYEDNLACQI